MPHKDPTLRKAYNKQYRQEHLPMLRQHDNKRRTKHKHGWHRQGWKARYGLTATDFFTILADQGGLCAICQAPMCLSSHKPASACVDHDHRTGKVRGLLCLKCNVRVGVVEMVDFVSKARKYLERNG